VEVLSGSWHCENPGKLRAYNEEYKACFPVHDSSEEHMSVPSLDNFTADLLVKKHGSKAFSVASKKITLHKISRNICFSRAGSSKNGYYCRCIYTAGSRFFI
jgi:hypothetical protein